VVAQDGIDLPEAEFALTLDEFIDRVASGNLGLAAAELARDVRVQQFEAEKGIFEPEFVGSVGRGRTERENNIEQETNQGAGLFVEREETASVGVEGMLPTGGRFRIGTNVEQTANNLVSFSQPREFDDEYQTFAGVSITQPLLKNAGTAATRARLRVGAAEARIGHQQYRKQLMGLFAQAEAAYWDLVFAQEQARMRGESVDVARKVLEDNVERVKGGKMSELEVLEAEAGVAMREAQQSEAVQQWMAAANLIRTFLSAPATEGPAVIVASDRPDSGAPSLAAAHSMAQAIVHHPDYLAQLQTIGSEDVRLAYARNQRWPQLDLVASYGLNGLGETCGKSWDDLEQHEYEAWTLAVELRLPLGGGQRVKSELQAAKLRKRRALLELKAMEIELLNVLSTVHRNIRSIEAQLQGYRKVVDFSERLLEVEMSRLEAGKSDSRKVLQIEQDLSGARVAHLQTLVKFEKALVELRAAEGTVLAARSLEPEDLGLDMHGDIVRRARQLRDLMDRLPEVHWQVPTPPIPRFGWRR